DLAAVDGDGRVAAFCALWFDKKHRAGYFEPIGTVPAHRRRGLGKALMIEGMRRLQKIGAAAAFLGHSADNGAGAFLYESVGMAVFDQEYWHQKQF
ncbi:MAG: GNAT family N-acetyltransferase, partial [Chloroflexi bacterium]|nr:GNAT family N-acetyltransferase [Chloroflexota bacterium]